MAVMLPLDQTKLHQNRNRGNCLAAALASIFELRIEHVPAFEEMPKQDWRNSLKEWLYGMGVGLLESQEPVEIEDYYIAVGISPRNIRHCVVCKAGEIVHDPHPSREGILGIDYTWSFYPL